MIGNALHILLDTQEPSSYFIHFHRVKGSSYQSISMVSHYLPFLDLMRNSGTFSRLILARIFLRR
jgi:hypothetical protein